MNPPPSWTERFPPGRLALLIALLLFVQYSEVICGTHSFFYRDFGLFTYPVAAFTHDSFWRGEIPLWNPLNNCGVPFLAQWNTTVCYPLSWIYILLPLPWSLDFFCLGHLVLAAVAMYALAFRWTGNRFAASVAGLAFALNGLTFNCLMWTSNLAALAWMPLVILCGERAWSRGGKSIALAAFAGATQMLAGAPEIIALTWLLLGTLWVGQIMHGEIPLKNLVGRFMAVGILVFGLSAVQLLPFFELLAHTQRDASIAGTWAMPVWGAVNFLVPLFRCSPSILGVYSQDEQQWTSSYYLGIGVLALAAFAIWKIKTPRVRWLAVVAFAGVVLAMGDNGLIYKLIKWAIPAVGLARYPIKFVVLTAFALPLLAAFAVDLLTGEPAKNFIRRSLFSVKIIWFAVAAAGLLAVIIFPRNDESAWLVYFNGAERVIFLVMILAAFDWFVNTTEIRRGWIGLGILILLGFDVLTHAPRQNPTVTNRAYGPLPLAMSARPQFGKSRALVSPAMQAVLGNAATADPFDDFTGQRRALFQNVNLLDSIPKVNGFFSVYLRENSEVLALIYTPTNPPAGLLDFLGVAQISAPDMTFQWQARTNYLPLITGGQKPVFADGQKTLAALFALDFDPRAEVYLPLEAKSFVTATNSARVKISAAHFAAQRITAKVFADAPALAVVAQSFYPGWRAFVDGQPVKLLRANHAFQAVAVPAGEHELKLVYEDRQFYLGALISAGTLLGLAGFYFLRRKKTPI